MRNHVRELRERMGITQDELAEKIKCSRATVISIEKGKYDPSLTFAMRLARVFSVPLEEVFTLDDQNAPVAAQ